MLAGSSASVRGRSDLARSEAMLSTMAAEQINVTWAPAATAAPMAAIPRLPASSRTDLGAQADTPQPQRANYVIDLVDDL